MMTTLYKTVPFLFVSILCGTVLAADDSLSSYKGLRVPPMPPGHEAVDGYLINTKAPVEYAMSEIWFGKQKMWWLKKLISRDTKGKANFEVVSAIARPEIPKEYYFVKGNCKKNGVAVSEIIAATKYDRNKKEFTEIHSAWYVDTVTETFRPYPTVGVTCINESYGL